MGGILGVFQGLYISSIKIFSLGTIINIILSNVQITICYVFKWIFKNFVFIIKWNCGGDNLLVSYFSTVLKI